MDGRIAGSLRHYGREKDEKHKNDKNDIIMRQGAPLGTLYSFPMFFGIFSFHFSFSSPPKSLVVWLAVFRTGGFPFLYLPRRSVCFPAKYVSHGCHSTAHMPYILRILFYGVYTYSRLTRHSLVLAHHFRALDKPSKGHQSP